MDGTWGRIATVAVGLTLLAGCKEGLSGACKESDDCAAGLFCARTGDLKGTCTASCAPQADYCNMRWGEDAVCHRGYCMSKSHPSADPCEGRCPSTTKCVDGTCVPK